MGMRVDAAKARKTLYGITAGMTNHELVQYSGYGVSTVRLIRKNPEKYKKAIQEQGKERPGEEEDKKRICLNIQRRFRPRMGRNHKLD